MRGAARPGSCEVAAAAAFNTFRRAQLCCWVAGKSVQAQVHGRGECAGPRSGSGTTRSGPSAVAGSALARLLASPPDLATVQRAPRRAAAAPCQALPKRPPSSSDSGISATASPDRRPRAAVFRAIPRYVGPLPFRVDRREIAGCVVEEHVLGARVRRVDFSTVWAGVPLVEGATCIISRSSSSTSSVRS